MTIVVYICLILSLFRMVYCAFQMFKHMRNGGKYHKGALMMLQEMGEDPEQWIE